MLTKAACFSWSLRELHSIQQAKSALLEALAADTESPTAASTAAHVGVVVPALAAETTPCSAVISCDSTSLNRGAAVVASELSRRYAVTPRFACSGGVAHAAAFRSFRSVLACRTPAQGVGVGAQPVFGHEVDAGATGCEHRQH